MNFTSINKNSLAELGIAFEACLLEHEITFRYTDLVEKDGIVSFIFCNDPEKARSVEFDGKRCIGLDVEYIAKEILEPLLPRLKAYARVKSS